MECGVCTGSCPISRQMPQFSPRQAIKRALLDRDETLFTGTEIWRCLSCARCSARCPAQIDFPEFIQSCRVQARRQGIEPALSHHGVLQIIADLQIRAQHQNRTSWAEEVGAFRQTGDILYFVGCAPFFDVVFRYLDIQPLESCRSILRLLNLMGIEPVIHTDERCCGHDALWSGEEQKFLELAKLNLDMIRRAEAKTVLFACPEGYFMFKEHYPRYFGSLPFEVMHLTEFLAAELPKSGLTLRPEERQRRVTYQDPCRLGRWMGHYDEPRNLLKAIPGVEISEMERNRENSLCCGTSAWMECSSISKSMQLERLQEASATGAETLITACPKCQIHLTCAQSDQENQIRIEDIYSFLVRSLSESGETNQQEMEKES